MTGSLLRGSTQDLRVASPLNIGKWRCLHPTPVYGHIQLPQSNETRFNPPPADPPCCHPKKRLGILAFGSLINDPNEEIREKIIMRIKTSTPFGVEFGRYSGKTRGGAPTLVKHEAGSPVCAEILILDDLVSVDEAKDMLWNRERRTNGSGEKYSEGTSQNSVLVRELIASPNVASVLYTDFHSYGKIDVPTAADLAQRAIESVSKAEPGMDGITYLMNPMAVGISTLIILILVGSICP